MYIYIYIYTRPASPSTLLDIDSVGKSEIYIYIYIYITTYSYIHLHIYIYVQALDAAWSFWDGDESDGYGSPEDAVVDNCIQPPLLTCLVGSSECCDGLAAPATCSLACLSNAADQSEGICVHKDTCFQHQHCLTHNQLCAGNGTCVAAHVYIKNSLGAAVDGQVFSADAGTCEIPGSGYSSYEGVPDFGRAHGMCSFRDWHHYQNITRDTLPGADGLLSVRDRYIYIYI